MKAVVVLIKGGGRAYGMESGAAPEERCSFQLENVRKK